MDRYLPRIADGELRARLSSAGAVVIEGARACGKTETGRRAAASAVLLDTDGNARSAALVDPALVLEGAMPRLLDEWQVAPAIWNHVRRSVDDAGRPGMFILTGSAVPPDDAVRHSGAGRFSRLRMRPMSLFESGHSTGAISLAGLFDGTPARAADGGATVADIAERIVVGGWPAHVGSTARDAGRSLVDYLDQISRVDLGGLEGARRDPVKVGRLLTALARSVATQTSVSRLAVDAGGGDQPLARTTADAYLDTLTRVMVLEEQRAWGPHLRSRAAIRTAPTRHFVCPSLATAALRAGTERLLMDVRFLGLLFESLVVRDLRVYSQPLDGEVLHSRDSNGVEADAVVQLRDGRWGAIEAKLGVSSVDEGAASLLRFARTVDHAAMGRPAFLAVVAATGFGYRRPDGVDVVPIGALGP